MIKWNNLKSVIGTELFNLKLFKQFTIIIVLSFVGEVLHALIPFPIPASIYGILLLFFLLERKILQVDDVKEVADFLIFIMPLLFIPAAVGLIDAWNELYHCSHVVRHGRHGMDHPVVPPSFAQIG